jgi:histidyl-tRNA synthetase
MIHAIRGTYDVLPGEIGIWHALENRPRQTFHRYAFGEVRTPVFEATDLFVRGVGEETETGVLLLRDMATKEQRNISEEELLANI